MAINLSVLRLGLYLEVVLINDGVKLVSIPAHPPEHVLVLHRRGCGGHLAGCLRKLVREYSICLEHIASQLLATFTSGRGFDLSLIV